MQWLSQQADAGFARLDGHRIEDDSIFEDCLVAAGRHGQLFTNQVGRRRDHCRFLIQKLHVDPGADELVQRRLQLHPRCDVLRLEHGANAWTHFSSQLIGAQSQAFVHAAGKALLQREIHKPTECQQRGCQESAIPQRQACP